MPVSATSASAGHLIAALLVCFAVACESAEQMSERGAAETLAGDPSRAPTLLRNYGCRSCHVIPGVVGTDVVVGPPLAGIASRSYIAGVLPNTPDNMLQWIQNPRGVDSLTAMPNVGVTPSDARHIASYLYTLR
jgi:cytochrome c